jgi:hypothetical protein
MFNGHYIPLKDPSTKIIGFDNGEKFLALKNGYSGSIRTGKGGWYARMPDEKKVEYLDNCLYPDGKRKLQQL